ncbi:MAG: hypothetical protein AABW88_01690 [Nanoarchaeota archaeon]
MQEYVQRVKELYKDCLDGRTTPAYTAEEINEVIGGITATFYTPQKLTLQNHTKRISLNTQDNNRRKLERREELVLWCYAKARQNGSATPGEIHMKGASTKHYKAGLEKRLREVTGAQA